MAVYPPLNDILQTAEKNHLTASSICDRISHMQNNDFFIGRARELELLEGLWSKPSASLVVCAGRRRIGKSTLIEKYAERSRCKFIEISGLAPDEGVTDDMQRKNFCESLAEQTGRPEALADTWPKAFAALADSIRGGGRTVVLLDEISWMGGLEKAFPAMLKNAWDMKFSRRPRLVFVVCGSVSAWIGKNILRSKAFVGRVSLAMDLKELPLSDCAAFWGERAERTTPLEMLDVLSVTGGVPKYLSEMQPRLSADENIRRMCFLPEGFLFGDFDRIFHDVFKRTAESKRRILEALADGPKTQGEVAEATGIGAGGSLTDALGELVAAGFVSEDRGLTPGTGKAVREVRYRICDNYVRFYLRFVAPRGEAIRKGFFRLASMDQLPGWKSILGTQFETLVLNNLPQIAPLLGLGNALVLSAAPFVRNATKRGEGTQIDLLVQTRTALHVVEIKRRALISASVEDEVREKIKRLRVPRGLSVRTALVYAGELAPEVAERGYFDALVPVERLLGLPVRQ